jgi:hypothetical protein
VPPRRGAVHPGSLLVSTRALAFINATSTFSEATRLMWRPLVTPKPPEVGTRSAKGKRDAEASISTGGDADAKRFKKALKL